MDQWKKEDEMGSLYMDRGQGVRAAFEASSDLSGQDVAESLRLAKSLGIPENIVLEQRDWAAQEEKARTIEKNSLLAQWAEKDRKNAAFVRDDPDALLDLFEDIQIERRDEENRRRAWEERHGSIRQTYVGPLEQIPMLLEEGLRDVGYSVGGFISGAARFLGNGTFTDSEGNVHPYRSNLLDSFADRVEKNLLEKRKADPARLQAETEIGGYAQDVIRQIPQLGAQILATVGTGGLGGVSFMGSQIAGGQYLDLRERGVEADRAFKAGLANAALQAPLEQIGLGRFMNIFKATGGRAIAKRVLEGTGTEALTEYLQTYPESATELWALLHEDEGAREWLDQFVAALPETHREGLYSAAVAAPFGLLGGLGRAAYDRTRAQEAETFVDREKALHAKVEATQVKKLSPESTESALRAGGMTGNVMLPADKVLQLYQSGQDILTPLGLQEQDVIDAAQMGQELEIPRSRLHAMLDQPSFDAVVSFMRPVEDAMTLEEAADVETRISEDAETLGSVYAEYQAEQSTIDAEVERVRSEIESSLKSVPGVATQIESDTALDEVARGERMTPERVADLYSSLLLNWAQRRQERTGTPVAESLRRFNVQGLVRDQRGRLMTPEDLEKSIARTEQQAADREFLGHILGRLDVNSLVKDYPDARKELTAIYGRSLFEKRKRKKDGGYVVKKGTNGIDELAQELENRGLIEAGGGADALIERLKQGKRYYQFIDPARVQANPNARDVVPVLRRVFHMNTMELDDSKATVTVPREEGMSGPLTDIYQHDALYELYPELREAQYEVVPEERLPGNLAGYSPKYGTIYITTDPDVTPAVIAHEVQHAIQDVDERFDFGLSEEASQEVYSQVEQELKGKLPLERARALAARIQYLSQAHEIQAFDTQNRFDLTAEERAKYEPNNPSTYYQTAYHGTPHRFDAFSLDAIGTGEGNQAHGWGLYFAKERGTSERYKTGLGVNIILDGKPFYDGVRGRLESSTGNRIADDTLLAFNGNIDEAIAELQDDVDYGVPEAKEALDVLQGIKADNRLQVEERGQLFEVDIPENDVLLDEGKSYFKQSDKVRDALAKAGLGSLYNETYKYFKETFGDAAAKELDEVFEPISRGVIIGTVGPDTLRKKYGEDALDDEITAAIKSELNILIDDLWDPNGKNNAFHNGRNIYKYFSSRDKTDRAASESLNAAGIKGITYEGGQDGRAFVVFDDEAINILNTYYQQVKRVPRASIIPVSDGYLIQLYKKADLSSLLHETGHFFLMEMEQDMQAGIADDSMRADYATLMTWLGAVEGEPLTREQHEQFARGFEAYLREGKSPSKSLESPFARFKKWLLRIYRQARQLNVELTDDVRGVFDRLLATDAEVNARAVENGLTDLSAHELDALGVQGADRIVVSNLMKAAADTAVEKLQQDRDRRRQQQLRIWAKEAREEVDTMPVYVARRDIQKLGLDMETVRREYGDQAERLMRSLPGSLRREGGVDPELFALEHGYEDAGSMFSAILEAPRKSERIRQVIAEKQAAWDATFNATDYLLETDEAARQMELVGRYIREAMGKTVAGQDVTPTQEDFQDFGRNAQRVVRQEAFQRIVSQKLAAMPAGKAVQAGIFRLAMRRAISEERRAIVRGNWGKAFDANIKARLNMEFARQATELGRRIDSLRGNVTRFVHMARADPDSRFLVGALAQHYGLGRLDPRLITDDRNNPITVLDTWIQKAETDGYPMFVDAGLLSGQDMGWRELSLDTLENVADALNQIMTVERNRRKLFTAQGKADLDAVADEIVATVGKFRDAPAVKTVEKENPVTKALKNVHAIHTKVEALCLALDGDRLGPVWEHIYRPITKAEDEQSKRFRAARDELRKLFSVYSRKELSQMRIKKEYVESIGEKLTKENRLAVALNLGNAVNIERIRSGHGWTDEQIRDVVRPLTRHDWKFVQSVWNYLNTFKEDSFRLQEEVTGIRPKAVEAQPLQVTTADGETLNQSGGYYPIKYNAEKGVRAFEREQKAMDQELFGGRNYGGAQTRQGHLKERAAGGTGEPLLLELSVITDHVFNVIHDLSYRKAVLDVAKVLRHDKVKKAIRSAVGTEMYNQLKPWLMDVANERQEPMHAVHRMANWARASTSIMQMGWKITTMLAQPLGITQTAEVLGYKDTAAGMKKVYADPLHLPDLLEETFARSPMMADRIRSYDREIRDMTKKLMPSLGVFGWVDKIRDSAFIPMGVFQMGVDLPTWWGGYTKGLREFHGDEIRAAEYADSVVRMAQGSGSTKDLARVQRGGPLLRLTTMFYSYFNTFYNLAARRFTSLRKDHSPAAVFQAANTALLLWFVPSVLGELAVGRGPDDDEEWENWMGMQILQYPFQAVVGIRELASGIFGEYGYQITPAESAPTALVKWFKAVNKALEEEDAEKLARPTAEAVGYLFGLPMKQPIITVGNVWDYVTGNDPDFYIRDLFFVKPKERR